MSKSRISLKNITKTLFMGILVLGFAQAAFAGPKVLFKTNQGNFVVEQDTEKAPS